MWTMSLCGNFRSNGKLCFNHGKPLRLHINMSQLACTIMIIMILQNAIEDVLVAVLSILSKVFRPRIVVLSFATFF